MENAEDMWKEMGQASRAPPTILATGDDGLLFTTEANTIRELGNGQVSVSFNVPRDMPKRFRNVDGNLANGRVFTTQLQIDDETTRSFQTAI